MKRSRRRKSYYPIAPGLYSLIYAWAEWRSVRGSARGYWPEIGYEVVSLKGPRVYDTQPAGFVFGRCDAADTRTSRGEEFNPCVMALGVDSRHVEVFSQHPDSDEGDMRWREYMQSAGLSWRRWNGLLFTLQSLAKGRGLL